MHTLNNNELVALTLQDTKELFDNAKRESSSEEFEQFTKWFWPALREACKHATPDMQCISYMLEDYKRSVGRHCNKHTISGRYNIQKYNNLEQNISNLTTMYKLNRKYAPKYITFEV